MTERSSRRHEAAATRCAMLLALAACVALGSSRTAHAATAAQVTAGSEHSCVRTSTGDLRCWGSVAVGDGGFLQRLLPVEVPELTGSTAFVDAGDQHTCAVTTTGSTRVLGSQQLWAARRRHQRQQLSPVGVV